MSNTIYPAKIKGLTYTVMKTMEWSSIVQKAPNGDSLRIAQFQNPLWHFTLIYDYLYDTYYSPNNTMPYGPYTDLQALMGFFAARQGQFDDFLFLDPVDYSASGMRSGVWAALTAYPLHAVVIDRNGHAQLATTAGTTGATYPVFSTSGGAVTDGSVTWVDQGYWPTGFPNAPVTLAVVTDGAGNYYSPLQRDCGTFLEDVTDLVPNTLSVFAAGSPTTLYTLAGPGLALPGSSWQGLYLKWPGPPAQPVTATFNFYFRLRFEEDTQDFERWAQGLWTIGGSNAKNGAGYVKLVTSRASLF